ncbi:MAG: DMT family transporter, partial [Actinobacteria bacterium]|nr:DMT family transporter [Actinomycetota bacterium]
MPELLILGAAFCWSAGLVMVRGLAGRAPILAINATRILAPALAFLGVVAVTGRGEALLRVPWTNVWAILGSVALGIVAGDLCMLTAIRSIGVARAYALGGTYPLVGVLIAVAFRGESLSLPAAAGVALVVTGG